MYASKKLDQHIPVSFVFPTIKKSYHYTSIVEEHVAMTDRTATASTVWLKTDGQESCVGA